MQQSVAQLKLATDSEKPPQGLVDLGVNRYTDLFRPSLEVL